jgi:hypothetical protein
MTTTEQQELNALIAEEVMGWPRLPKTGISASMGGKYYRKSDGMIIEWLDDYGLQETHWNPLENPAQALEVFGKCLEKTCAEIHLLANGKFAVCWENEKRCRTITKTAPTLELAICKFAAEMVKGVGE